MLTIIIGCIEEIEPEPIDFESVLIIEATILDKEQRQTIFVTRSFDFGDEGPRPENGAQVLVRDDIGNTYNFSESQPGIYKSNTEFAALAGRTYELEVSTNDGMFIMSQPESIRSTSQIDTIYAERIINDDDIDGISIKVESFDPLGQTNNYRYLYEETYKIIAPKWNSQKLVADEETDNPCDLKTVDREREEQICYRTDVSNSIILFDTNNLAEDRVDGFEVRFIDSDNYIISHRYSILVKQIVQSDVAYTYYNTLAEFSGNESLFSQTQPGFLIGNLKSTDSETERVLGFFEVVSIDEKRLFFEYEEFYAGEPLPPYIFDCVEVAPPLTDPAGCVLLPAILNGVVRFSSLNEEIEVDEGPFNVVSPACSDCTVLGSNIIPEFWEE